MANKDDFKADDAILAASQTTVAALFRARAVLQPTQTAIEYEGNVISYDCLLKRANQLAAVLASKGVGRGDRIAILSRNRPEYIEAELAAATLGAMIACLNWRLAAPEIMHSINLVTPKIIIVEEQFAALLETPDLSRHEQVRLGADYDRLIRLTPDGPLPISALPEDGLTILYTSGTTGLPKAAVISHRAMVSRALLFALDLGILAHEAFVAWAPFYHMASTDHALATLLRGGTVIVIDGYQSDRLIGAIERHCIGWLVLIPGMIESFIAALKERPLKSPRIRLCGAMADLVPPHQIAEVSELLGAPFVNSFGSTETGLAPATRSTIGPGEIPQTLSKQQSSLCEVRLVNSSEIEVEVGTPGEVAIKGPTVFSGYWNAEETNTRDFRGGWFHMGDVFIRNVDGTLDFVDRAKYMIKTGGENVYPAEIERVILADPRVLDAAVVRASDARWGETPVAFVATKDPSLTVENLMRLCHQNLAGYKRPSEIRLIEFDDFPRSTSGKIQRHELEDRLALERKGIGVKAS